MVATGRLGFAGDGREDGRWGSRRVSSERRRGGAWRGAAGDGEGAARMLGRESSERRGDRGGLEREGWRKSCRCGAAAAAQGGGGGGVRVAVGA